MRLHEISLSQDLRTNSKQRLLETLPTSFSHPTNAAQDSFHRSNQESRGVKKKLTSARVQIFPEGASKNVGADVNVQRL